MMHTKANLIERSEELLTLLELEVDDDEDESGEVSEGPAFGQHTLQ